MNKTHTTSGHVDDPHQVISPVTHPCVCVPCSASRWAISEIIIAYHCGQCSNDLRRMWCFMFSLYKSMNSVSVVLECSESWHSACVPKLYLRIGKGKILDSASNTEPWIKSYCSTWENRLHSYSSHHCSPVSSTFVLIFAQFATLWQKLWKNHMPSCHQRYMMTLTLIGTSEHMRFVSNKMARFLQIE